ncbi:MAG: iron-containing alcohol dehydrogenase [Clostridia bacterium]|nr:iron-containing alcohol dehydrogenase [Clostridia bacterium]
MESLWQQLQIACEKGIGAHCYAFYAQKRVRTKNYGDLKKSAEAVASFLAASGLAGSVAALTLPACFERLSVFFGLAHTACSAVVLPQTLGAHESLTLLQGTGARAIFCTAAEAAAFLSEPDFNADQTRLIAVGDFAPDGCTDFADVLTCPAQAFSDVETASLPTVSFPAEPDAAVYSYEALASLNRLDVSAAEGAVSLSVLPFSSPYGAALSLQLLFGRCVLAETSVSDFRGTASKLRPGFVFGGASECLSVYERAFSFARAICAKKTVADAVASFFGSNVRQVVCVKGAIDARYVRLFSSTGIPLSIHTPSGPETGPALVPSKCTPVSKEERRILDAAAEELGLQDADLNDNLLLFGYSPARLAEFALRLHLLPQTVYDSPFLFALAVHLQKEKFLLSKPDLRAERLIRKKPDAPVRFSAGAVFLTDGESFFGAHLLKALLSYGQKVYCLVRDKQTFWDNCTVCFGNAKLRNVKPVEGDFSKPYFGMTATAARKYKDKIDAVIHIAAYPADCGGFRTFASAVVDLAQTAVDFARITDSVLEYFSDLRVFGGGRVYQLFDGEIADEKTLYIGQQAHEDAFVHSLFEAERTVLLARLMGAKTNILRLGLLTPRFSDGKDAFSSSAPTCGVLLNAVIRTGAVCEALDRFGLYALPVDAAADAAVKLILTGEVNSVFHLTDKQPLSVSGLIARAGIDLPRISNAAFFALLTALSDDPGCSALRDAFFFRSGAGNVLIDAERSDALSGLSRDPRCAWDKAYLSKWLTARPGIVSETKQTFYPPDAYRVREGLRAELKHPLLLQGKGSLSELSKTLQNLDVKHPLIAAENEKLCAMLAGVCPEAASTVIDLSAPEQILLLAKDADNKGADALIAAGGEHFLAGAKEAAFYLSSGLAKAGLKKRKARFSLIVLPYPLGAGESLAPFLSPHAVNGRSRTAIVPALIPDGLICDPDVSLSASKDAIAEQIARMLINATEGFIAPVDQAFSADTFYAPEVVKTVFRFAKGAVSGDPSAEEISALQSAGVYAGLVCRRMGYGFIHALSQTANSLFGISVGETAAACALPVLHMHADLCAFALSELAVRCGFSEENTDKKENAELFLSALDTLFYSTLGFPRTLPFLKQEQLQMLAAESLDVFCGCGCAQRFTEKEILPVLSRIFSDTGK